MSPLKIIIPTFVVLGLLQAAVLTLPFVYWRFAAYLGPLNKFLFGSFLCVNCLPIMLDQSNRALQMLLTFSLLQSYIIHLPELLLTESRFFIAFVAHPLLIIALITFTIAPTLLSIRHNVASRLSTAYTALVPQAASKDILSSIPFLSDMNSFGPPKANRDWLLTVLSSYVGWKMFGALPTLMILLVLVSLWKGGETDRDRGWLAKGLRDGQTAGVEEKEKGVATRSERTDVSTRSARTDVQVVA